MVSTVFTERTVASAHATMSTLAEAPPNGWPWQLELADVIEVGVDTAKKKWYRVECSVCGFGPLKTTLARWRDHYGEQSL